MSEPSDLLSVAECCRLLGKSPKAFHAWRTRHGIPNRVPGRRVFVFRADLLTRTPPPTPLDLADWREAGVRLLQGGRL
jgi:hypothetical protein